MFRRKHTSVGAFGDNSFKIKRTTFAKGGDFSFSPWTATVESCARDQALRPS
jgi:hypothetical protein